MFTVTMLWLAVPLYAAITAGFFFELGRPGAAVTYFMYGLAGAGFAYDTMKGT